MEVNIIDGRNTHEFSLNPKILVDVYRSTSTMPVMLRNNASYIIPVGTVSEAKELKKKHSDYILAGERYGFKVPGFDIGNSPYEASQIDFKGKIVIFTSTNGTKVLQKIKDSERIFISSFVNIDSTVKTVRDLNLKNIDIVTSGRPDGVADEDIFFAQAVKGLLLTDDDKVSDYIMKTREGKGTKRLSIIGGSKDIEIALTRNIADFSVIYRDGKIEKY